MSSWLSRIFGTPSTGPWPRERPSRLEVERLEERLTPSIGSSFFIDSSTDTSLHVATASAADGRSVAVFTRETSPGNRDIFAQRYDASHNPVGGQIVVNLAADEINPDVAMDSSGRFVVVWEHKESSGNFDVRFRLFDNTGNGITAGDVAASSVNEGDVGVCMDSSGDFVVSYTAAGALGAFNVFAARYDSSGSFLNTLTVGGSTFFNIASRIDCNDGGKFSIVYLAGNPPDSLQLKLKRYDASGTKLSSHKIAGLIDGGHDVGVDNAGNTTVVYERGGGASDSIDIFWRRVSKTGVLGSKQLVAGSSVDEVIPRIAVDRVTGQFVVAYLSADSPKTIVVQEYTKSGSSLGLFLPTEDKTVSAPCLSIDASGRYFLGYLYAFSDTDNDVLGRFGEIGV